MGGSRKPGPLGSEDTDEHWQSTREIVDRGQNQRLELSDGVIKELALVRLEREFIPGLRKAFPGFDRFPTSAQRALIDLAYNRGVAGTARLRLADAVRRGAWVTAAELVPTSGAEHRQRWQEQAFRSAAEDTDF